MPETKRMIVLYNDVDSDVESQDTDAINGEDLAHEALKAAHIVPSVEMETMGESDLEAMSGEGLCEVNRAGGFLVANLSASEAKRLASESGVLEVIEDEQVHAFDGADTGLATVGQLELDGADTEIDAANLLNEGLDLDAIDAAALTFSDSHVKIDVDLEMMLNGDLDAGGPCPFRSIASESNSISALPKDKLLCIVRSVVGCLAATDSNEVSAEHIQAAIREAGVNRDERQLADVVLWNIRLILANYAWRLSTGVGVRVAVIDTGIDPSHSDLRVCGGVSYVPGVTSWRDDQGHGTHVAGTIAAIPNGRGILGVAPQARLYAVKVLNRNGSGMLSWILNGLTWCRRSGMHVCNLSLGSRANSHDPTVYNRAYEHVGRQLRRRGILAVAAAGNDGSFVGNPARCPSYLAVSAIDPNRRRARFSNFGPQVELTAPGVSVVSTVPAGGYRSLSGTSMACPHVAGVAALVKARRPTWHGDRIRVHMWRTALDLGTAGRDHFFGFGQVNALRAVR